MALKKIPLEEARDAAHERAAAAKRLLACLEDRLLFLDSELYEAAQAHRQRVLPELRRISTTAHGELKLNASVLLVDLGDIGGTAGIVTCLASGDSDLCVKALHRLGALPWHRGKGGYQVPLAKGER
jgi:hypothetical protein